MKRLTFNEKAVSISYMKEPLSSDSFITAREVAALLPGTSDQTVLRWARDGKIPVVTLPSGRRFFRREDVEVFLEPSYETPPSASTPDTRELF